MLFVRIRMRSNAKKRLICIKLEMGQINEWEIGGDEYPLAGVEIREYLY